MTCCCGHSVFVHRPTLMSVPLTARQPEPLYPLPAAGKGIDAHHPAATLEQQVCWCGCSQFDQM